MSRGLYFKKVLRINNKIIFLFIHQCQSDTELIVFIQAQLHYPPLFPGKFVPGKRYIDWGGYTLLKTVMAG